MWQARSYVERASTCCYDLIMIDGRFREVCALHALRLSHNHTTVLIHDSERYSLVNRHYHVVARADTLAILRPRALAVARARSGDARYTLLLDDMLHHMERRRRMRCRA